MSDFLDNSAIDKIFLNPSSCAILMLGLFFLKPINTSTPDSFNIKARALPCDPFPTIPVSYTHLTLPTSDLE